MYAAGDVRVEDVPDPSIVDPTAATLYALPVGEDDALMPSLITLSDVLATGHHAAVVAGAKPGDVVAGVGDGAVGLCGVIAPSAWAPSRSSSWAATRTAHR